MRRLCALDTELAFLNDNFSDRAVLAEHMKAVESYSALLVELTDDDLIEFSRTTIKKFVVAEDEGGKSDGVS
ncbi:hypothetical protein LTR37_015562 [Vermiconidia calcicola]|uniref:Uncharacterized protein n=1 Tax=Vermiconidia calcicola TaxID=1690605 RepID=A0ACC3MT58_9PEZI|nr:hypothetical protein LTR37_015562 [Vermiconidia calcicola]